MSTPIPAAVLGATGYVSGELLRLLAGHPGFELVAAVSDGHAGKSVGALFPHLANTYDLQFASHDNWIDSIDNNSDLALFSAAPHGASAAIIAGALEKAAAKNVNVHVVDASADFRYSSQQHYEAVYGIKHGAPELIPSFQCGVPEQLEKLTAAHVGHPGCFATAVLLAIVPLLSNELIDGELFVTGVTGSTGSGRQPQAGTHHPERHSNMYAYKALEHRHAPEIVTLATAASGVETKLNFVPHSGPFARGIHVTAQARIAEGTTVGALLAAFKDAYQETPFVSVVDGMPRLKDVVASNRCDIGLALNDGSLVVTSVIDNLVKGAAGGAVQWMNRLWDLPETSGLLAPAPAWT